MYRPDSLGRIGGRTLWLTRQRRTTVMLASVVMIATACVLSAPPLGMLAAASDPRSDETRSDETRSDDAPARNRPAEAAVAAPDHRIIEASFRQMLEQTQQAAATSQNVTLYSRRGDALFFTGQYSKAVAAYEKMVDLQPALDASHWRLGIAHFFAGQADQAVAQFEKYHAYDDVDRENGIWRYLSQFRATDAKTARKELLRYQKDDREPFPAVYRLFDGSLTPQAALAEIPDGLPAAERDKRLFYTELYIGMHLVVKQQPEAAITYLSRATSRQWPQRAGGGPEWMWHVGRLQLKDLVREQQKRTKPTQGAPGKHAPRPDQR